MLSRNFAILDVSALVVAKNITVLQAQVLEDTELGVVSSPTRLISQSKSTLYLKKLLL